AIFCGKAPPPTFVRELRSTEVVKGLEATLECEVTGTPPFEVKWLKNNKEMFSSKKYAISTKESIFTLNVTNCDVSDVGEYQCIISNEGGSCSCSTRLSLKGHERLAAQLCTQLESLAPGPGPALSCTAPMPPPQTGSCCCGSQWLLVQFLSSCSQINMLMQPPSFMKKPEPLNVFSGTNITFTSIIKGSPPLEVKWFRGSVELVPGHKCSITLQDSLAELELFDVHPLQSGDYTCQVSNEAGKISCTTHLFVKGLSRLLFLIDVHETIGLPVTIVYLTYVIDLNRTPTKRKEDEEDQTIDILELLKNVDPKEYEKYARMYGITDFRGLLQAFELLKQTREEENGFNR
uniref:Ig-like domain-containing protein n=1 Tax=Anas zonorhyncha TaxID=75864 RepID=A0A8B9VJF3_9AVES